MTNSDSLEEYIRKARESLNAGNRLDKTTKNSLFPASPFKYSPTLDNLFPRKPPMKPSGSISPTIPLSKLFRRKPTFVSFDWDNDRRYKFLLTAMDANTTFDFKFKDASSKEVNSNDVGRVKAALTSKINEATHFLSIVGQYANQPHRDAARIGFVNWLNFEAHQAVVAKKKIVVVRLQPSYSIPNELNGARGVLVEGFSPAKIIKALNDVT